MRTARCVLRLVFALVVLAPLALLGEPHTPKPGSPERKAICDAMRIYITKDKPPLHKPILFKVEFLRVEGDYAGFKGFPVFKDGSEVMGKYLPDIVYTTILKRQGADWRIISDLSRSDVPPEAEEEIASIQRSVPSEVPGEVLPEMWRKLLRR